MNTLRALRDKSQKRDKSNKGNRGLSAYEIACRSGFNGGLADWLQSIKGERGEQGLIGKAGLNGEAGADGWSPVLAFVPDGERRVAKVVAWVGGTGQAPETGWYIGQGGPVGSPADALDLRGPKGKDGQLIVSGGGGGSGSGEAGPQGEQGPQGDPGEDGNTVLYGSGAPDNGLGVDGNFYIRTDNNFIYGPKASGVWPAGTSLVGPQGETGAQGEQGATGAEGPEGPQGETGPQGAAGFEIPVARYSDGTTQYGLPGRTLRLAAGTLGSSIQNSRFYTAFLVSKSITATALSCEVTTQDTNGSASIRLGVVAADNNLQPTGAMLAEGSVSTSGVGIKTLSINGGSGVVLSPGWYLIGFSTNSSVVRVRFQTLCPISTVWGDASLPNTYSVGAAFPTGGDWGTPVTAWTTLGRATTGEAAFALVVWTP